MRMKLAARLFLAIFLVFQFLFLVPANSLAHCHQLSDKSGDSGSSFGFTDIVSTELSNQGNSIGVRITTNGTIPNGFGTTGQMVFGVMFPARLLSSDTNDDGINFITVHWKEDGTGWEGSQFIFRESLQSVPWSANIKIDGNSAGFSIPKKLIGKGDLAYLVSIGLISEDGESSDYAPDNVFSDCYVVPQESPVSAPQTAGGTESQASPQTVSEAPKKEGNKFVERPGVNRLTQKDPGESLVLPEKVTASSSPKIIQSPQAQATEETKTSKPPALAVGLIFIALLGIGAVGASKYMLKNQEGEKQLDDCGKIRQYIKDKKERIEEYKKRLDEAKKRAEAGQKSGDYDAKRIGDDLAREERILKRLEEKLAECEKKHTTKEEVGKDQKTEPKVAPKGKGKTVSEKAWEEYGRDAEDTYLEPGYNKPSGKCREGDRKYAEKFECGFYILDKDGDVEIETDYNLGGTGEAASGLGGVLKKLGKLVGLTPGVLKIPAKAIGKLLESAGEASELISKMPQRMPIRNVTIPVIKITNRCRKFYMCIGGRWVERLESEGTTRTKEKMPLLDAGDQNKYMDRSQLARFLKEEIKRRCRDENIITANPCKECQMITNESFGE